MPSAPKPLHPDILAFLRLGLSIHVGACDAAGLPQLTRALALRVPDGRRIALLLPRLPAAPLLDAVRHSAQVAMVVCQPTTHRTLQIKGGEARVVPAAAADWPQLAANHQAFTREIEPFGFDAAFANAWFGAPADSLLSVEFTPSGAWNQTPGPGAGSPVELAAP